MDIDDLVALTGNFTPGPAALYEFNAIAHPRTSPVSDPVRLALPGLPTGLDLSDFELLRFGVPQSLEGVGMNMIRPAAVELSGLAAPTSLPGLYTLRLKTTGWTFGVGQTLSAAAELSFFHYKIGDMNCDGLVNNQDIAPFVLALTNPTGFQQQFGYSPLLPGDVSGDGVLNNQDIAPFVALLTGGRPDATMRPGSNAEVVMRRSPFAIRGPFTVQPDDDDIEQSLAAPELLVDSWRR